MPNRALDLLALSNYLTRDICYDLDLRDKIKAHSCIE